MDWYSSGYSARYSLLVAHLQPSARPSVEAKSADKARPTGAAEVYLGRLLLDTVLIVHMGFPAGTALKGLLEDSSLSALAQAAGVIEGSIEHYASPRLRNDSCTVFGEKACLRLYCYSHSCLASMAVLLHLRRKVVMAVLLRIKKVTAEQML